MKFLIHFSAICVFITIRAEASELRGQHSTESKVSRALLENFGNGKDGKELRLEGSSLQSDTSPSKVETDCPCMNQEDCFKKCDHRFVQEDEDDQDEEEIEREEDLDEKEEDYIQKSASIAQENEDLKNNLSQQEIKNLLLQHGESLEKIVGSILSSYSGVPDILGSEARSTQHH